MRRQINLKILLFLLLVTEATAQAPRVVSLVAEAGEQHLAVSARLAHLFSPKIVNTIRSGMPAVIRLDFRLVAEPDREVQRLTRALHLSYDLWNERYHLRFDHREQLVMSFAELEKICSAFEEQQFLPLDRLSSQPTYRLRLQITVIPISAKQDQQFRDWLENSGATEESAPGEERASGFRLNLSKLLSFFLGKKDQPFGVSEWAMSPPFRLGEAR
ncbi:MAG: DUF4390 domain-containing protein [candidate division KSB1 bacterium]|nr:DUF4390 domain-containing protein [candidate division KSB1 bacterium]MDZ7302109.1 DUF4390 domain-containing protein [candidate division KSB1 bacterium]MDZ7311150.1 DUF4390 domain-containing protein [candidate division KSB1 bacterium]